MKFNEKWETEPIDKKLFDEYVAVTKKQVEKCEKDFCEMIKHAKNVSYNKSKEAGEEYYRASTFLKGVETICK